MKLGEIKGYKLIYLDFGKNIYKVFEDSRSREGLTRGSCEKYKKEGWSIIKETQPIAYGKLNPTDTIVKFYDIIKKLDLNEECCSMFTWFKSEEQFLSKIA